MKKITKLFFVSILALASLLTFASFKKADNKVNAAQDSAEFDTTIDTVSLSDLTWGGSKGHTSVEHGSDANATYEKTSTNGSLILKLKYDVVQADGGDKISFCIYTGVESEIWNDANGHVLLLRQDGIYMMRYKTENSAFSYKSFANGLAKGVHDVEFGRIYLVSGDNQGKYYSYVKIDGTLIGESYNPYDSSKVDNRIFFHYSAGNTQNTAKDAYGYEEPMILDVSDLKGNSKSLTMNEPKNLTYDNSHHTANYSIVFRFKYTPNGSNQIHLSCDGKDTVADKDYIWDSASSFILFNNSGTTVHLGKSTATSGENGYVDVNHAMTSGTTYDVEYGRLAKMSGADFLGTYYTYLKINGVVVAERVQAIPEVIVKGNRVFITDSNNSVFTDVAPADVEEKADIISVSDLKNGDDAVANGSTLIPQGKYTYNTTSAHKSVILKMKFSYVDTAAGGPQFHFWDGYSSNCIWLNDKTHILKDGTPASYVTGTGIRTAGEKSLEFGKVYITEGKHAGMYHIYVKADGTMLAEYYSINNYNNNILFVSNANGVISDICSAGHTLGAQVAGSASTCSQHGTLAYYECSVCSKKFADDQGTQQLTSLVAPLEQHTVVDGECTVCHAKEAPSFTTQESITITEPIALWKYTNAVIEFDSSKATLTVDFVPVSKTDRCTEKKALTGVEVISTTGSYYHYTITLKDLATNNASGYESVGTMRFRTDADYANFKVTGYTNPFEEATSISVNDLKYQNDKAVGKITVFNTEGGQKFKYTAQSEHKSVIFSFVYTVETLPTKSDYCYGQFHFSNTWSSNCLWPRNDKTFLQKDADGYVEGSKIFAEPGTKTITYGKVYISSGDLAGKYYLFIKADGVLLDEYVTANDYNNENMFCTLADGTKWYDVNYVPDSYETADQITVADLYFNGKEMPNKLTLDAQKAYTYTATAEHKSVVFKFKMTVSEIPEKSDYDYGQYYFTAPLGTNAFWLRNDATFIYKDASEGGVAQGAKAFAEVGTKVIEMGRLYVTAGDNAGKYYLYVKADDELLVEYYSSNELTFEGMFMTGKDGRIITTTDFVECTDTHQLGTIKVVETPACSAQTGASYYFCKNCGKLFAADGTTEISVIPGDHTLESHAAVAVSCEADGSKAYYECTSCHKLYEDAAATTEVTAESLVIAAHHEFGEVVEAVAATCTTKGNVAYYHCSGCDKDFAEDKATVLESTEIAAHHTLEAVAAKAETCTADGNKAYYHCSACGKNFSDAEGTTQVADADVTIAKHHTLSHVAAVAPTCTENGSDEYWECSACHKKFSNDQGTQEVGDVVVEATGHSYVNGICSVCGDIDPNFKKGCKASISICGILGLAAAAAVVFARRKRELN